MVLNKKTFSPVLFCLLLLLSFLLASCTSSWKAPVSSYSIEKQTRHSRINSMPANSQYYTVVKGDTLYSIAWRTANDYIELAAWNRLAPPYTFFTGQVLQIRRPVKSATSAKRPVSVQKVPVKPEKRSVQSVKAESQVKQEKFKQQLYWSWPTTGKLIKGFRQGDDTRKGIVLTGKLGQPVLAAEEGKVVYSGSGLIGYGKLIIIKHNNKYLSAYGHNRKILVSEGQRVTRKMKIAEMGKNGSGVPALHFEIRKNGSPLNPAAVLPKGN